MQLPEKTFLTKDCQLYESDYECNGEIKPLRLLQLMQDAATVHAEKLGVGWNVMNEHGMLWVISKMKVVFHNPVTRETPHFTLYTWPLAPTRFVSERCFEAVSGETQLFSATSIWTIISHERKILPAATMNEFYHGDYSEAHSDASAEFTRIKLDDEFVFNYEKVVRRSDLDQNGHANNTNYVTYAVDVLDPSEKIREMEICYHKELKLGDTVKIYSKRVQDKVFVLGLRDGESCFCCKLTF